MAPPANVPMKNLHKISIEGDIDNFSEIGTRKSNDSIYDVVSDKIAIYREEGFLTPDEFDHGIKYMVVEYVPVFLYSCYKVFNSPVWPETGLKEMEDRITELKNLKMSDGSPAVTGSSVSGLDAVASIIKNYWDAKAVADNTEFYSIDDAAGKIRSANMYRAMEYLKNCSELYGRLSEVKVRIGNSHYSQVSAKVDEMSGYRNMSESAFKTLTTSVNSAIKEYAAFCSNYGSSAKPEEALTQRANGYYKEATNYYSRDFKRQILVDTQGQWVSMHYPSSAYRAFCSTKNYHRPGLSAIMTFTVTGYDNFTFYVRSNGENNSDYLMVGIDKIPTKSSHYASTKGKSTAGTLFSDYTPVQLNNMLKDRTYRIYVVYEKDNTIDYGEDRGYVLIPY